MPQFSESDVGLWTSYTPVWTSSGTAPTLGNATLEGEYTQINKLALVKILFTFGSTSAAGTGDWRFSLPLTISGDVVGGSCYVEDAGTGFNAGNPIVVTSTTIGAAIADAASSRILGAAIPITWATGDDVRFFVLYKIA